MSADAPQPSYPPPNLPPINSKLSIPLVSTASTTELTKNKRARPTISCLECRRKKLKCDRVLPCSQCTKSGRQSFCEYTTGPPHLKPPPSAEAAHEERARKKMKVDSTISPPVTGELGSWHGSLGQRPPEAYRDVWPPALSEECKQKHEGPTASLGRIFVKGDRSRYLGLGDRMVMLDHFEDAKGFITSAFESPDMKDMMVELSAIQATFQKKKMLQATATAPSANASLGRAGIIAAIIQLAPSSTTCTAGFSVYLMFWEGLIRVLHLNSLSKVRFDIWQGRQAGELSLPPSVKELAFLQTVLAMTLVTRISNSSLHESDRMPEETIVRSTDFAQRYVDTLKGKERLEMEGLKVQVLLILAHQNNLAPPAELWQKSGNLVRTAMVMGLHLVSEDCTGFSLFEKEQARKMWRSIVELDIQFSLAAGMPAAIRSQDFKSRPLLNVDDNDLSEIMTQYPIEKPQHQWTDSTPQIALGTSLKERLDAVNILGGSIDLEQDASAILIRAGTLERFLHLLPTPTKSDSGTGRNSDKSPGRLFTKIMLDVFIRRPSLSLYRTIALSPLSNRYPAAQKAAVRSSIAMLSHLDALDPTVADLNMIKDRDLLNHFHVQCKNDIIQAAIMLCIEIRRLSLASRDAHAKQYEEVPWTKHSLTRIVENTLNSLIQRLGEFGSDLKDILPLSIVLQAARSDGTPEERRKLMKSGAERILIACRRIVPSTSKVPTSTPAVYQNGNGAERNTGVPSASPMSQHPHYWTGKQQFHDPPSTVGANIKTPAFGDTTLLFGHEIDFQDFDFGFAEWGMD